MPLAEQVVETREIDDYEIWTEDGWKDITHAHKTVEFDVWRLVAGDYSIECADNHIVFRGDGSQAFVKELCPGDLIKTESGETPVTSVEKLEGREPEAMYDLTVDSESHSFYSSGILSHNSTMTQIFVLWTILFHNNQKVAILAQKEDAAMGILDRIQLAYRRLPLFLKTPIEDWNKKSMMLTNRSSVKTSPTSRSGVRGMSCNVVVLDEAAFIDTGIMEEFWQSIFPTITSSKKSKMFLVSTANGIDNKFYDLVTEAQRGYIDDKDKTKTPWSTDTIFWHEVPGRDEEWVQLTKGGINSQSAWDQEFESVRSNTSITLESTTDHTFSVEIGELWDELEVGDV